jgi:hypothetical protein
MLLELHGGDFDVNEGWIFGSLADIIWFLIEGMFVGFSKNGLVNFIKEKSGVTGAFDPIVAKQRMLSPTYRASPHYNNMTPYQIYHRYQEHSTIDNKDSFIWVPLEDLLKVKHFVMR